MGSTPVELTMKYATTVDSLLEAWQFVMEHLDEVGECPNISIYASMVCD